MTEQTTAEKIKDIEQAKDKALLAISEEFMRANDAAETKYSGSAKTAAEFYRQTKEDARRAYTLALEKAEEELSKTNQEADDIYRDAPSKAHDEHNNEKANAREAYNQAKRYIEVKFDSDSLAVMQEF